MGAAVSIVDFDRDGWPDLYVTNSGEGSQNRLYRNRGDGTFEDVAAALGVADLNRPETGVSMGAVWGDYDNDGYEDLFVYKWGRPELFHNDGGRGFTRVTDEAGAAGVGQHQHRRLARLRPRRQARSVRRAATSPRPSTCGTSTSTRMMPESFEYAKNGGRKYLFRNLGDGRFEEVSEQAGLVVTALGARCGRGRPARHRLSRPVHRQRLRRLGAVRQRGRQAFREIGKRRPASASRPRAA